MPRLIVHGFTLSLEAYILRRFFSSDRLLVTFVLATLLGGCQDHVDHKDPTWNERIAEQERIADAAKGDSVTSHGGAERTVTYYVAGEKVKEEYYYHDRLVSCYNYANGKLNGYGIEWDRTGTLYSVAHYVDGKLDGPIEEHERAFGFKMLQVYRMGELLSSDTMPLTDSDSPKFARDFAEK